MSGKMYILNEKKKLFSALHKFYITEPNIRKLKKCNFLKVHKFCYRWPL